MGHVTPWFIRLLISLIRRYSMSMAFIVDLTLSFDCVTTHSFIDFTLYSVKDGKNHTRITHILLFKKCFSIFSFYFFQKTLTTRNSSITNLVVAFVTISIVPIEGVNSKRCSKDPMITGFELIFRPEI